MELTINENVGQLRLRIAKAKATKQAEEVRRQLKEKLLIRKKSGINSIKQISNKLTVLIRQASDKFILTAGKPVLAKEVSDFLLESQLAIDKLPTIYRKLYKIEPLEDLELFEGRNKELLQFKNAYTNWTQNKHAATTILGEKWGGMTSFINYLIKEQKFTHSLTRYELKHTVSTAIEFIELMKSVFKNDTFTNLEDIIEFIENNPKRIVFLEDIQNMYLRKIDGFDALILFFQLIIKTRKQIFWVTSSTLYSWSYLNKTTKIDDYFSYKIPLQVLTDDQIVNLIWKRNRISGFNIRFELSESHQTNKKFQALEDNEQQSILKKQFFNELNKFAKSNVSLALIFWLLSTKNLTEDSITIGTFKNPDLNFLASLSTDKIHLMQALIIHDGLPERSLSTVLNISDIQSSLLILSLLEDGIIFEEEGIYMINPMIYRNTISLLSSKNLIH